MFTLCQAYVCSIMTSLYDPIVVLDAAVLTAVIVIGITVYAFTTKHDFVQFAPGVFCCLFLPACFMELILCMFLPHNSPWMIGFAILFCAISAFY